MKIQKQTFAVYLDLSIRRQFLGEFISLLVHLSKNGAHIEKWSKILSPRKNRDKIVAQISNLQCSRTFTLD